MELDNKTNCKNCKKKYEEENLISPVYVWRNMLNALLGDDPAFTIYEVDEPLPDGTHEYRERQHTLNVVCTDVAKLVIARDHIGERAQLVGEVLNIDYYFSRDNKNSFTNVKDRPSFKSLETDNTSLDIAMLFEGNPHFSKFYTGWGMFGPWYCVAFKPELIQYRNDNGSSLHGRRSCAMEDIALAIFTKEEDSKIRFSTENIEDFSMQNITIPTLNAYCTTAVGNSLTWTK